MNKDDFFDKIERFPSFTNRGEAKGVRMVKATNYGLDKQIYNIWLVGSGSLDESLVIASDILIVKRYTSEERATRDLVKFRKWFNDFVNSTNC